MTIYYDYSKTTTPIPEFLYIIILPLQWPHPSQRDDGVNWPKNAYYNAFFTYHFDKQYVSGSWEDYLRVLLHFICINRYPCCGPTLAHGVIVWTYSIPPNYLIIILVIVVFSQWDLQEWSFLTDSRQHTISPNFCNHIDRLSQRDSSRLNIWTHA